MLQVPQDETEIAARESEEDRCHAFEVPRPR